MTQVWIVADVKTEDGSVWELMAVCSSREKAVAACTDRTHCVWSMNLDEVGPSETVIAPDCEYPLAERGV
jgi:hypothetical protein